MDNMERTQLMRELAEDSLIDTVKMNAPEHCRECKHLTHIVEDNRFDAFGKDGKPRMYGEVDIIPICELLDDRCPLKEIECPLEDE